MTAAVENLRWGLVGCGWLGRAYAAPAIAGSGNGELLAACDRDAEALASVPAPLQTADLDALLASDIDAVYVATPNASHRAIVEACCRAGKHVLCEKPLARTAADAEAMYAAAGAAGVLLATAFDQRWHPAHQVARRLIAEGALGRVSAVLIRYACWTPADWAPGNWRHDNWRIDAVEAGGGAMIDLAPHGLDLTMTLLGEPLTHLACLKQRHTHDYAVDDGAAVVAATAGGTLLNLSVAYNCPDAFPRRRLEVVGDRGRLLAENTMGQTPGGRLTLTDAHGQTQNVPFDAEASPFVRQMRAFANAVLGQRPWPFPATQDLTVMRLLDAANAAETVSATVTPHAGVA